MDKGQRARRVQGKVVKKQFVPVSAETFTVDFSGMNDRRSRLFSRVVSCEFDSPSGRNQNKDVTVALPQAQTSEAGILSMYGKGNREAE